MKRITIIIIVLIISIGIRAQVPGFACFGGCIFLDSSGVFVVHHVRSNVFPISHFVRDFTGTGPEWQNLENMVIAEANKQLAGMGFNTNIQYPILLSNFDDQQKTQETLNIWNSRIPPEIQIRIGSSNAPAIGAAGERMFFVAWE